MRFHGVLYPTAGVSDFMFMKKQSTTNDNVEPGKVQAFDATKRTHDGLIRTKVIHQGGGKQDGKQDLWGQRSHHLAVQLPGNPEIAELNLPVAGKKGRSKKGRRRVPCGGRGVGDV